MFRSTKTKLVLSMAAVLLLCAPPAMAAATPAAIAKAIRQSQILDPKQKVIVAVNGLETIVSTYENPAAMDKAAVCKLDALLIARQVLDLEPEAVIVSIQFYKKDRKHFRKVAIKAQDIERFSAGELTKDELLNALQIVESEQAPPRGAQICTITPVKTSKSFMLFRYGGLSFYFPAGYVVSAPADPATSMALSRATADHLFSTLTPRLRRLSFNKIMYQIFLKKFSSPGSFVCMARPGSSTRIMLTVRAGSVQECIAEAMKLNSGLVAIAGMAEDARDTQRWSQIGYGGKLKAYECNNILYKAQLHYVYFGDNLRTCILGVSAFDAEFPAAMRDFDTVLKSVQYVP